MNDLIAGLQEVQARYKNYNLLIPTATDVQLNPFYRYHVEEVPVDIDENSGDIFKVGSTKVGQNNGKDVYADVYSLTKPLLNKLAMAAGIQFNPKETYGERLDRVTYRAQAQGAMRKADGTCRTETDQKVICLEDEEEKYRIEFADKAVRGISDQKAAKAAEEIFSGKWIAGKDRYGNTQDRYGKAIMVFVIDEKDRDRYIERSVMVNMSLLKKTWAEKAMTGAKLRVIRALLGLKGTYTKEELKRNFAIPTVVFSPDYHDPEVRKMMMAQGMASVTNMFGTNALPVKKVDFDEEAVYEPTSQDMDNAAFSSDYAEDDEAIAQDSSEQAAPVSEEPPTEAPRADEFECGRCGTPINERVYEYSIEKFGEPLCIKCQRGARR